MDYRASYRQLLPDLQPHWRTITLALVGTLGAVTTLPVVAYLVGRVVPLVGTGDVPRLLPILAMVAGIFVLRGACLYSQDILMARAALQLALDLRVRVYRHLHRLGLSFFETAATGDLSYRLTEDVDRVGEVVNRLFHQGIPCVLTILVLLGYMVYLNWQLLFTTLVVAPLVAVLISWFGSRLLHFSRLSQNRIAELSTLVTEVFAGIRLVKAFAAEDYEVRRFAHLSRQSQRAQLAMEQVKAIQFPILALMQVLAVMALFAVGTWQIGRGQLSASQFVSFITGIGLLIEPIQQLTANYNDLKQAQASLDRVFELLQVQPAVQEVAAPRLLPPLSGQVEFRHLDFAYNLDQPVLEGLNLQVPAGEVVALVGHSGAGKTTLVNLLQRLYDPQAGEILLDGIDICTVSLASLRQQIGVVPQETILFSGTIAENIAYGQPVKDLEAIRAAAEVANADQFIQQFSQGYQTWIGERGATLSGGQRQRLAIARAVLKDPPILILDEATSALDAESEALVQEALERVMQGRTVFVIAHRLSTVRRADRILVLEGGKIVESGTHHELLQQNGGASRYAQFYTRQFS